MQIESKKPTHSKSKKNKPKKGPRYGQERSYDENQQQAQFEDQTEGLVPNKAQNTRFMDAETMANRY